MSGLTVLAVDDERPALDDLLRLLRGDPRVEHVELASTGAEALEKLAAGSYDAVFLDVRMPGLDGVGLARVLRRFANPPALIFVTAYESAAVEAFELRALDYLLKPVGRARMDAALERVIAEREARHAPQASPPGADPHDGGVIPVDNLRGGGTRLLQRSSVLCLQSHGDYVRILADSGRFLLRASLTDMEQRWEPHGFVRVHRRYVVNLARAVELRPLLNGTATLVLADGTEVPVARRQVPELRRRLQP